MLYNIDKNKKVVFIFSSKCGATFFKQHRGESCNCDGEDNFDFSPLKDYKFYIILRDPFLRFISGFYWLIKPGNSWKTTKFLKNKNTKETNILITQIKHYDDLLELLQVNYKDSWFFDTHFTHQVCNCVDHIINNFDFEIINLSNLSTTMDKLNKNLSMKYKGKNYNKGSYKPIKFTEKNKQTLEKLYKKDIFYFNKFCS
mgnify:CR=1 FL=1